jgi:hypothetical protein
MLVSMKLAADFSRRCAVLTITHSFLVTHPLCQVRRLEPCKRAPAHEEMKR